MKASEMRTLTETELLKQIESLRSQLFNLKFQNMIGQLDNPLKIRLVKRDIARAFTMLNEQAQEVK